MKTIRFAFQAGVLMLLAGSILFGQTAGKLIGVVSDPSSASVPDAKVTAQNVATGYARTVNTDSAGAYAINDLPIGKYTVKAEHAGFAILEKVDIDISVAQTATLNFSLKTGTVSEVVQVESKAEAVDVQPGETLQDEQLAHLPINGRDFARFAFLTPGAVARSNYIADMSFNGQHAVHNQFSLDGVDSTRVDQPYMANGFERGSRLLTGSQETIAEFRVQTSGYQAQYGRAAGTFVNVASKSGANDIHGTAFDYFRNDFLDARNFFNTVPAPQASFRYNDFGGNVGGPLKRDKSFYFVNYEGSRQGIGVTGSGTTLSNLARTEALSASPVLAPIVGQYPIGTSPTSDPLVDNYTTVKTLTVKEDTGSFKIDQYIGEKDSLFFRLNINEGDVDGPLFGVDSSALGINDHQDVPTRTTNFAVHEQHIFSPSFLNETLIGMQRFASTIGAQETYPEIFLEALSIDPGDRGIYREHNTSYQVSDSMSYTVGSHSLKWGAGSYRIDVNNLSTSTASLYYQTVADFIANSASNASLVAGNPGSLTRGFQVGLFVQDTWQVRPGLTIDYGLRWDYETPIYDPTGRAQTFDTQTMTLAPPGGAYYQANYNDWGPRLGIAWQVAPRVVVRTGYGIFYQVYPVGFGAYSVPTNNIPGNTNLTEAETPNLSYPLSQFVGQGTSPLPTVAGFNSNKPDIYSQQWNFTLAYALSGSQTLQVAYIGNHGLNLRRDLNINYFDPAIGARPNPNFADINIETASGQNVYAAMQVSYTKRFARGLQIDANYSWAHAIDDVDDQALFDAGPQDNNNYRTERGNSSGDARHTGSFNLLYELPFGKGKRFLSNSNGLADKLVGGWQIATLGQFRSGIAGTVYIPLSQTGNGDYLNQRPNVVPGVSVYPAAQTVNEWLNAAAFSEPAVGTFGDAGRGIFFGPKLANVDFSMIKNTSITERLKMQIRGEFFNILNHPNFAEPDETLGPSFGVIFNTLGRTIGFGTSRQIQLSGRFNF
jgi:Carboxypeptidase regulatory-like domain/TonB dependent receptor